MPKPLGIPDIHNHHARLARDVKRLERRSSGPWHYIGADGEPLFQNGWGNVSGLQEARFRYALNGGVDLQGSLTGGTHGTVAFTLPAAFCPDSEVRLAASDDQGAFLVLRVLANGDVIPGLAG